MASSCWHYYPQITEEEMWSQKNEMLQSYDGAGKRWNWDLTPGFPIRKGADFPMSASYLAASSGQWTMPVSGPAAGVRLLEMKELLL